MYEVIAVPRKIQKEASFKLDDFNFDENEIYSVKNGRDLIKRHQKYLKEAFLKGADVNVLLKLNSNRLDSVTYSLI